MPQPGGGQRVAALYAEALAIDYDVTLLSPKPLPISWWENTFGVSLKGVHTATTGMRISDGGNFIATLNEPYDILVNMEYAYWSIDARRAAQRFIVAHDAHPLGNTPNLMVQYHAAWPSSEYGKTKLADEKWPIPAHVVYPPVYRLCPESTKRDKTVLCVARFDHHRNMNSLPLVLESWIDLEKHGGTHGHTLIFAGWLQDQKTFQLLAQRAHGYAVEFAPNVTTDQLDRMYDTARLLINIRGMDMPFPSTAFSHEALGMVTIEAINHGLIPIVHDFAGHKETVPIPELRVRDEHELTALLSRMLGHWDVKHAAELRAELQRHSVTRFSRTAFLERFKERVH